MKVRAWRLVSERWLRTSFSGEGARLAGGRWNSKGTGLVYLGGSLALAALELLVHLDHEQALAGHFAIPVEFDDSLVAAVAADDLPADFPAAESIPATQRLGDSWVASEPTPLLRVPSAVIPVEHNYLFNPAHPDSMRVEIGEAQPFSYDKRLAGG